MHEYVCVYVVTAHYHYSGSIAETGGDGEKTTPEGIAFNEIGSVSGLARGHQCN